MTLSKDQFMNYNLHEMYALYCDYEEIIANLKNEIKAIEENLNHLKEVIVNQAETINDFRKTNENLGQTVTDLEQKLKEKQLIIDAKKFADFKPIDNSRVGMTTPTMHKDKYSWTALDYSRALYPPRDQIIEVRPQGSSFSAPGILMKWSETAKKWLRLDGNESRNTWGEWRIATNPWIHAVNASIPNNRILEVVDISGKVGLAHWFEDKKVFVKVDHKTMFMTNNVVEFSRWRVFIQ